MSTHIETHKEIAEFITAGHNAITALNEANGHEFKFRIVAPRKWAGGPLNREATVRFVKALVGVDFVYIGCIFSDKAPSKFVWTKTAKVNSDHPAVKAFNWIWNTVTTTGDMKTVKVFAEKYTERATKPAL